MDKLVIVKLTRKRTGRWSSPKILKLVLPKKNNSSFIVYTSNLPSVLLPTAALVYSHPSNSNPTLIHPTIIQLSYHSNTTLSPTVIKQNMPPKKEQKDSPSKIKKSRPKAEKKKKEEVAEKKADAHKKEKPEEKAKEEEPKAGPSFSPSAEDSDIVVIKEVTSTKETRRTAMLARMDRKRKAKQEEQERYLKKPMHSFHQWKDVVQLFGPSSSSSSNSDLDDAREEENYNFQAESEDSGLG